MKLGGVDAAEEDGSSRGTYDTSGGSTGGLGGVLPRSLSHRL